MRSATSDDNSTAVNATLDGMVACIVSSLESLLDAGETRIAVGMPTFYSLGTLTGEELVSAPGRPDLLACT